MVKRPGVAGGSLGLLLFAWMAGVGFVFWLLNGPYLMLDQSGKVKQARAAVEPFFKAPRQVSM